MLDTCDDFAPVLSEYEPECAMIACELTPLMPKELVEEIEDTLLSWLFKGDHASLGIENCTSEGTFEGAFPVDLFSSECLFWSIDPNATAMWGFIVRQQRTEGADRFSQAATAYRKPVRPALPSVWPMNDLLAPIITPVPPS